MKGRRARVVWGSGTDPHVVRAAVEGQDVVVHMAAKANPEWCMEYPVDAWAINVGGTQTVLEALRPHPTCRLVHVSSCEVYGAPDPDDWRREHCGSCDGDGGPDDYQQDEASPMRPSTIYAASKCAADRLVYAYIKTYGTRATIVRPCNIYGPGQRAGGHGGVIPTMVARSLAGLPLVVRGDGRQTREFMHVTDVTGVYTRLIEDDVRVPDHVVNVGSGQRISIMEIAMAIQREFGTAIDTAPARPGEVREFRLSSFMAQAHHLMPPRMRPFDRGLDEYIAWARAQTR